MKKRIHRKSERMCKVTEIIKERRNRKEIKNRTKDCFNLRILLENFLL